MELKRMSDMNLAGKAINGIKRIRTEIVAIVALTVAIWFIPPGAKQGVLALFITKTLFVTLGVLYAHASRKFLFPFLDFQKELKQDGSGVILFFVAWYGVIIWAFAAGG
jgi:hypothetical protein